MGEYICREVKDPGDVSFDGTGFLANGYFCSYNSSSKTCATNEVLFDGTGLKKYFTSASLNGTCTGGTFLYFDGTGMKSNSVSNSLCTAPPP